MHKNVLARKGVSKLEGKEREIAINAMKDNFDFQDDPQVGIFWYDAENDELFGIDRAMVSDLKFNANGIKASKILHKTLWQKEKNRALSKGKDPGLFKGDYTQTPRGRVWERKSSDKVWFQLMVGSWIEDGCDKEHIIELVRQEFNLQGLDIEMIVDNRVVQKCYNF